MTGLNKILIANRGEIAVRIIRTARAMGYRTVAVYSEVDAHALHVQTADEAVCIGPAPASESYLAAERLLSAAKRCGADAVHPGYGFLSENAEFAVACQQAGMRFIGPPAEAIDLMGSKRRSKLAMQEAGVPCIPGYQGEDQSDARFVAEAERIGFPLMVKASAGGGGKGLRLVSSASELEDAIALARSEAQKAFGDSELILEKALVEPRHIEIQVFADDHGNVVHLGERDCSIQRRHQKVVEESPSPFVDDDLRRCIGNAATQAAKACNYRSAGTVEFLVDKDRNFYFLEMNTRLQVEHPVTELVTGQDLVAWQLLIAEGEPLPLSQDDISLTGHAMEVRLYAEDPRNRFLPQTGTVFLVELPRSEGIRIDHGISQGQFVSPHYDPMLAKIIAFGASRAEARRRLACAIEDMVLLGVKTNKYFLSRILRNDVFAAGHATTAYIENEFAHDASLQPRTANATELGIAAFLFLSRPNQRRFRASDLFGWRNIAPTPLKFRLHNDGTDYELGIRIQANGSNISMTVEFDGKTPSLQILAVDGDSCVFSEGGVRRSVKFAYEGERLFIDTGDGSNEFADVTHRVESTAHSSGDGRITASMDGVIVDILVTKGEHVTKGQTVVVLESMKMEHLLKADMSGVIESVVARKGEQVRVRQLLVEIASQDNRPGPA